jgi:voltage-gated potassium channel
MSRRRRSLRTLLGAPVRAIGQAPFVRRVGYYVHRAVGGVDRHLFRTLGLAVLGAVAAAAFLVTVLEPEKRSLAGLGGSFYWAVTTVIGSGDSSYVTSPGGFVIGWLLAFFGVAIVAALTAATVGIVIDFLLKEGQGMNAAGYRDHIVICGWNTTSRALVAELRGDDYRARLVVVHDCERNPAGDGVYFVRGDATKADDLRRAGIEEAAAAVVFPATTADEADMRSILTVLAIEGIAPDVHTVVEVNNPAHAEHMTRAGADEVLATSLLASRLLARAALYPGLTGVVADIVAGGEGSELYAVQLPVAYVGLSVDECSARLRAEHRATLLSVTHDGVVHTNPPAELRIEADDTAVVVAEDLGDLEPAETDLPAAAPRATKAAAAKAAAMGTAAAVVGAPATA